MLPSNGAQARIGPELAGYETISERLKATCRVWCSQRRLVEAVGICSAHEGSSTRGEAELSAALSEADSRMLCCAQGVHAVRLNDAAKARVAEHRQASHDVAQTCRA